MCPCCLISLLVWKFRRGNLGSSEPFAVQTSQPVTHVHACRRAGRCTSVLLCISRRASFASSLSGAPALAGARVCPALRDGASALQGQPRPGGRSPHVKTRGFCPEALLARRDRRTPFFPGEPPALFSLCLPALGCCRQGARQMLVVLSRRAPANPARLQRLGEQGDRHEHGTPAVLHQGPAGSRSPAALAPRQAQAAQQLLGPAAGTASARQMCH